MSLALLLKIVVQGAVMKILCFVFTLSSSFPLQGSYKETPFYISALPRMIENTVQESFHEEFVNLCAATQKNYCTRIRSLIYLNGCENEEFYKKVLLFLIEKDFSNSFKWCGMKKPHSLNERMRTFFDYKEAIQKYIRKLSQKNT